MAIDNIGRLTPADETLNHQIADTFATVVESDVGWTEKIWASLARKDGAVLWHSDLETARTMRISSPFCWWVPCEKFSRATSTPARTNSRKISGEEHDGPRVATILARRLWSTPANAPSLPVSARDPSIRLAASIR